MSLIKCIECGKEVSDKAPACPNCAYPLHAQTIEATGKKYKKNQLLSLVAMGLGGGMIFTGIGNREPNGVLPVIGGFLFLGGLISYIRARVGAWWHHG